MSNLNKLIKKFKENEIIKKFSVKENIYDLINCKELDMSKLIAWLLNSDESHGLKNKFAKSFINQLNKNKLEEQERLSVNCINDATILTEYPILYNNEKGRVDIIVTTDELCIVIENKFGTKEHNNQLTKYEKYFLDNRKNKKVDFIFVYLDINYEEAGEEINSNWITLDYKWIKDFLNENISCVAPKIKIILKEFRNIIVNSYDFDKYIDQLCLEYHEVINEIEIIRDKKLLDFIFDKESFDLKLFKIYCQYQWIFDKLISRNKFIEQIRIVTSLKEETFVKNSIIEYIRPTGIDFTHKKTEDYAVKNDTYWPCYIVLQQSDQNYVIQLKFNIWQFKESKNYEVIKDNMLTWYNKTVKSTDNQITVLKEEVSERELVEKFFELFNELKKIQKLYID